MALSAATWNNGLDAAVDNDRLDRRREPSRLSWNRTMTERSLASATPTGGFQHRLNCARSASISFCDNCGALAVGAPSDGVGLIKAPVTTWRCGARLSSSAVSISVESNLFSSRFLASSRLPASSRFWPLRASWLPRASLPPRVSWPLPSAWPVSARASAIGSGSGFCGSAWPSAAAARLLLRRRRLAAWARRRPPAASRRHLDGGLSVDLGGRVFGRRLGVADLLDQRLGVDLRRGLEPAVDLGEFARRNDVDRQRFGRQACRAACAANEIKPTPATTACASADIVSDLSAPSFAAVQSSPSRPLLDLGDQRDPAEAGRGQPPHHPHHRAVIDLAVAAHIDALVEAARAPRSSP